MENVNGINSVWGVLHCGVAPGGPCNENNGIGASRACPGSTCQSAFHTYRFEWDQSVTPNQLRWYVDGQQFHSVSQGQLPADTWNQMTSHTGYFIILNVAMGGAFPERRRRHRDPDRRDRVRAGRCWSTTWRCGPRRWRHRPSRRPVAAPRTARSRPRASSSRPARSRRAPRHRRRQYVGWVANGDWLRFDGVDFGSTAARQFTARVASGAAGGVSGLVEVRLDSRSNAPIGSFAVGNTGGWQSWRTVPANITGVTGVHDVYLTFTSGQPADFVNVDWFTFAADGGND